MTIVLSDSIKCNKRNLGFRTAEVLYTYIKPLNIIIDLH